MKIQYLVLLCICINIIFIQAHASPIYYFPDKSSIIEKTPEEIAIKFSERIDEHISAIQVIGPQDSPVNNGKAYIDESDPRLFKTKIGDRGKGTYLVVWSVVSLDDGHFTKGSFIFSVGEKTRKDTGEIIYTSTLAESLAIFFELIGQTLLIGWIIFLIILRKEKLFTKKMRYVSYTAGILIIIGVCLFIGLKTSELQHIIGESFFNTFRVFTTTTVGTMSLYRVLLSLFILGALYYKNKLDDHKFMVLIIIPVVLMLLIRARVSHATASEFPLFSILITAIHLFFKELWIGSLIIMQFIIYPLYKEKKKEFQQLRIKLSQLLSVALFFLGITGVYILWIDLKDFSNLLTSLWGARFIMLSFFSLILLAIRMQTQLKEDKKIDNHGYELEIMLGCIILFITSFLIITTPPLHPDLNTQTVQIEKGKIQIVFPTTHEDYKIIIKNIPETTIESVQIFVSQQENGIALAEVNPTQESKTRYYLTQNSVFRNGEMKIIVRKTEGYDSIADFKLKNIQEISYKNTMDSFEYFLIVMALLISFISFVLYNYSKKLENEIS